MAATARPVTETRNTDRPARRNRPGLLLLALAVALVGGNGGFLVGLLQAQGRPADLPGAVLGKPYPAAPGQAPTGRRPASPGAENLPPADVETLPEPTKVTPPGDPTRPTFDEAIRATLVADPQIRAGLESIRQAGADALTASLYPNPDVLISQTLIPLTRQFTPEQQGGPPQFDFNVGYPFDWWLFGKRTAALVAASLGVRASEAEYADLIRRRVLETAVAYYDVLEAEGLREQAGRDVQNFTKLEALTRQAVGAGLAPLELSRVRLPLLRSEQLLRDADLAVVAAKARLQALMGVRHPDPAFDVAGELEGPTDADPPPVPEAVALALENRPDLQGLRWRLAQAKAAVCVEDRNAYPLVAGRLGYTRQFQRSIGYEDADLWGAVVSFTLPVFNRNQGNRLKARSLAVQSHEQLELALVQLTAEIEQAAAAFDTARENARLVGEEQLKLAQDTLASITKAYQAGGRPLIDVLEAQRIYGETYRALVVSRASYWRSLHRLNAAIGKQVLR